MCCCGTCEHHTSGLALDYLLRLSIIDTTVASCPTVFNLVRVAWKSEATNSPTSISIAQVTLSLMQHYRLLIIHWKTDYSACRYQATSL